MRRSASPTKPKRGCLIGTLVGAVALLTGFGFAARDLVRRYSPEPPRRALTHLPTVAPEGVAAWDARAAAVLEENERVLQAAKTLRAEFTVRRTRRTLMLARPNLYRYESVLGNRMTQSLSDGWLLWWSVWPRSFDAGFVYPDGRELSTYPFAGFFQLKKPDPSFAERVRAGIRHNEVESLTAEALPEGGTRVRLVWRDKPEVRRYSAVLILDFDARALPTRVQTYSLREGSPLNVGWLELPVVGWQPRQAVLRVRKVELDVTLPAETFVMKLPDGATPTKGGNVDRFAPVFRGFSALRGDGMLP